jgi:hypothetical protein
MNCVLILVQLVCGLGIEASFRLIISEVLHADTYLLVNVTQGQITSVLSAWRWSSGRSGRAPQTMKVTLHFINEK